MVRLAPLLAAVFDAGLAQPAPGEAAEQSPAARCEQLVDYYDRYGASRSHNSDGRRNHTRIGAEIDCDRGRYAEGIAAMEKLLRAKKFTPPPPGPTLPEDRD